MTLLTMSLIFEDANIKVFAQENAHFYFRRKPSREQAQIIFIPI